MKLKACCVLPAGPAKRGRFNRALHNIGAAKDRALFVLSASKSLPVCSIGIGLQYIFYWFMIPVRPRRYAPWYVALKSPFTEVLQFARGSKMSTSAKSVERDCDTSVPAQEGRCSLCRELLRDTYSHPGQWKCEFQQFILRHTDNDRVLRLQGL